MNKVDKKLVLTAALFGLIAVLIGAFGAHGLKQLISAEQIQTLETGVKYQMYHALFMLLIACISALKTKTKNVLWHLVTIGIILFSGSIYGLTTNDLTSFNFKSIALITPVGGTLLIISWIVLFVNVLKIKTK
ncbi:DUF423 domain-containing protein [Spongiivirga citrea]|uniref:DUF423 domain-containing protein n=1 Tax=Spongiivirga citrea TaxID=1481457 RepID=A0A6M0CJ01_9FLAO|nr:DUF423 domain-containing protein [Spongiivirga citrea]NER16963.1 DUF423 domain-containing protein [Spongiivirga citrea]